MNPFRRSRLSPANKQWADTQPSQPPRDFGDGRVSRPIPLDSALDGVDVHELESQTVFDQFFSDLPAPSPRR